MKFIFSGDRSSRTIRLGRKLRKVFGRKLIGIMLWDGYPSRINFKRRF